MVDLRGNWVFPRLVYAALTQGLDRQLRALIRFLLVRPARRFVDLLEVLENHQTGMEILLSSFALLIALLRALALLAVAVAIALVTLQTII